MSARGFLPFIALLALVTTSSCKDETAPAPGAPTTKPSASTPAIASVMLVPVASGSTTASASAAPKANEVGMTCLDGMLLGSDAATGFAGITGAGVGSGAGAGAGASAGVGLSGIGGPDMTTKLAATVAGHTVDVTPKEPTAEVGKALCLSFPAIHACFDAALESGPIDGTLELAIELAAGGAVTNVTRSGGSLTSASLAKCVSGALAKLTLGKPTTIVKLGYALKSATHAIVVKKANGVKMREVAVTVSEGLPPELIRRIFRQHFAQFRACYQKTLAANPDNHGSVSAKVVIDPTGAVKSANANGGTNTDGELRACFLAATRTLSFPAPENGKPVDVTYGIDFQPNP